MIDNSEGCFAAKTPQIDDSPVIPLPSLVVDSGYGWHLYWYLVEPCPADTPAKNARLKAINRGLALAVGGDPACHDLARILRIPGFTNHKPPARPVRIVARHPVRYTLADMTAFALNPPAPGEQLELSDIPEMTEELEQRFAKIRNADKSGEIRRAWRGEIGDGSSDSRYVLVKRLKESGRFTLEEIVAIICSRQWFNRRSRQIKDPVAVMEDAVRLVGKVG